MSNTSYLHTPQDSSDSDTKNELYPENDHGPMSVLSNSTCSCQLSDCKLGMPDDQSMSNFSQPSTDQCDSFLSPGPPVNLIPLSVFTMFSAPCFGIPAFIHAMRSRSAYEEGNIFKAWHHSKIALILSSVGNVLLAVMLLLCVAFVVTGYHINKDPNLILVQPVAIETEHITSAPTPEPILEGFLKIRTANIHPPKKVFTKNTGGPLFEDLLEKELLQLSPVRPSRNNN